MPRCLILYPPGGEHARPELTFTIEKTLNITWQNSSDDPQLVHGCTLSNGDQSRLSEISENGLKASDSYLIPLTYSLGDASDRCYVQLEPGEDSVNFGIKAAQSGSSLTT